MKRLAYRGVSFKEAEVVVRQQRYDRNESRDFSNGVAARSLFGSGIYLINDAELAAQYAFCHAEAENEEQAVILKQKISFTHPFILNYQYSESRLRRTAIDWKYGDTGFSEEQYKENKAEISKQIGEAIKEYLLYHEYDGIVYHINEEIIYYIIYDTNISSF